MFSGISKSLGITKITDEEHNSTLKKQKKGPYALPSEQALATDRSVLIEEQGCPYRISTIEDCQKFRDICLSEDGWTERHQTPKIAVYDKPNEKGSLGDSLNNIKVVNMFPSVKASVLYDCLHDPDFRKTWDTNMMEGFNICQLDPRNDIGYYSVAFPWPLASREFINMRCWMEFDNGEYMIFNRTVIHPDYPCTQKHVRGVSYLSGYFITPLAGGKDEPGCRMIFFTHGDVQGSVPHSLINMAYTKMTPSTMSKLEENAIRYAEWWKEIGRDDRYLPTWRTAAVSWDPSKNAAIGEKVLQVAVDAAAKFCENEADGGSSSIDVKISQLKKALLENQEEQSQQFGVMVDDAISFLIRRFEHEKRKPATMKEFSERLNVVLKGIKKAISLEK